MALPCWSIKTVAESHTHIKSFGEEVCDLEAGKSKCYSNRLQPLD